jgi:KDO2-lipid IV(A) lauroyltransferase
MKNAPVLHRIEYLVFLGFERVIRLVPHSMARSIGRLLGRLLYFCLRSRREIALRNLAQAFPEVSPSKRRIYAQNSFAGMASTFTDSISSARFDAVELCGRVTLEGWEYLGQAEESNKGIVILSAHLGAWEIIGPVIALYKGPMTVVGRHLDNPFLNRIVTRYRSRFGNTTVGKRGAARAMLRSLREKGRTAILIDQRVQPKEGIRVPFFDRSASTSPILARLSLKTGAPVVPIFAFAEPQGRYKVKVLPPIHPESDSDDPVYTLTRRYMHILEDLIRKDPGQWLWLHNRWK